MVRTARKGSCWTHQSALFTSYRSQLGYTKHSVFILSISFVLCDLRAPAFSLPCRLIVAEIFSLPLVWKFPDPRFLPESPPGINTILSLLSSPFVRANEGCLMGLGLGIPKRCSNLRSISTIFVDGEGDDSDDCCLEVDGFESSRWLPLIPDDTSIEEPFDNFAAASGIKDANSARASLFEGWSRRTARRSTA